MYDFRVANISPPRLIEINRDTQQMSFFVPPRRYDPDIPEIMDRPGNDPALLADDLRHLRIINRFFGGLRAVRRNIASLLDRIDDGKTIDILDLATGSADYPVDLVRRLKRADRDVHVTAVDRNPFMIDVARKRTASFSEITVTEADVLSLPYPDRSFDIVLCSLAIHHLSHRDAVRLLAEMNRLSRVGFIVNDLNRTRLGAWTVWLYSHVATTNPILRYDSYASIMNAFTGDELATMSLEAGIDTFTIKKQAFFRLILVGEHR